MDLIDRNALMRCIPNEDITSRFAIENAPTIEAEPVRHGKWIQSDRHPNRWMCKNCKEISEVETVMGKPVWLYCPHCGARMNEVDI